MKWMDTPSVTEMDRGLQGLRGFYEMDKQKKVPKSGNASEMDQI